MNATRPAARAALRKAGPRHQLVEFPGVDHAFFNAAGSRSGPDAAAAAYRRMLSRLGTYVGA